MPLPFLRRPIVASLIALAIGLGITALAWNETRAWAQAAAAAALPGVVLGAGMALSLLLAGLLVALGRTRDNAEALAARQEAERAQRFHLLEVVLNASPSPMWVKDSEGRWLLINDSATRLLGGARSQFLGKRVQDLFAPDIAADVQEQDRLALGSDQVLSVEGEMRSIRDDRRWGIKRKRGVSLPDGRRILVASVLDLTEQRAVQLEVARAQEELTRHRDNLQQLVDERTRELRAALDAAQSASRAKSEFLANMSHELRTPMHAILSFARLGRQHAGPQATDAAAKLAHYFARIDESAERLLRLLNELLDLSKLEAGRMHYELGDHDAVALANAVVQETAPLASAAQIRVRVASTLSDVPLRCDAVRIAQVVRNLLSNALKFTPAGGEVLVRLDPDGSGTGVRLSVEDTGVGIPQAELESIFQKFAQSTRTRSKAGGTGLGLAICREIVQAHGGRIWAESRDAGGSRFVVLLPGAIDAAAAAPREPMQRRLA